MKLTNALTATVLVFLGFSLCSAQVQNFNYTTNNGTITITGYNGLPGAVTIPSTINDLPVTAIGPGAFAYWTGLTNVTIPNGVTFIGWGAFDGCAQLTQVIVSATVSSVAPQAFAHCSNLVAIYFEGNAPRFEPGPPPWNDDDEVFLGTPATLYYAPGTTGWWPISVKRRSVLWKPDVQSDNAQFGVRTNRFGFTILWGSDRTVVVEACTDLIHRAWSPVATNTLADGSFHFAEPLRTNAAAGFYRVRSSQPLQPGQKLWEFLTPRNPACRDYRVEAAAAIGADGTVYVAAIWRLCIASWDNCGDIGRLYALTGATGEKVWESGDVVRSCPAIGADGTLYAPSCQRIPGPTIASVAARNITTGQGVWDFSTSPFEPSAAAVAADGMVYVSVGGEGKVYALDGRDGHTAWEFPTTNTWVSAPVVGAGGAVYVGSGEVGDRVCALAGATGQKLWEFVTGGPVRSSAAIGSDGTVYVGSDDGKLYALDGAAGHKRWEFLTGGAVNSSPAIGEDGTVYVGSDDKRLYALDGATGQKRWEFLTSGAVRSSPAIGADGTVYVGSDDQRLYALDGATGQKRWEFLTGGIVRSSPAISPDGTVYVGSYDAKVYAISSGSVGGLARSPWPKFRADAQNTGRLAP